VQGGRGDGGGKEEKTGNIDNVRSGGNKKGGSCRSGDPDFAHALDERPWKNRSSPGIDHLAVVLVVFDPP